MVSIDSNPLSIRYLAASPFSVETVRHEIRDRYLKGSEWRIGVKGSNTPKLTSLEDDAVVEFASCKEDLPSISRFARRYGSLLTEEAAPEVMTLARWVNVRYQFQDVWDDLTGVEHRKPAVSIFNDEYHALRVQQHQVLASLVEAEPLTGCEATGTFSIVEGRLSFVAKTLYAALLVKLFQLASQRRLRRCPNPDCDLTPYFLFTPHRRTFCSAGCANYGKRLSKLAWWNAQGKENRNFRAAKGKSTTKRSRQAKGSPNGTQKAR